MSEERDDWVLLARVVRPQGRRGEVLAELFTDFPHTLTNRKRVFLRPQASARNEAMTETQVQSHWLHKGRVVLKFALADSIEDAEKLRGCEVVVPRAERVPLADDAIYISDLIGMAVIDVSQSGSEVAGEVIDVEPEGAGPALLVIRTPAGEERLIPFVRAFLRQVDCEARRLEMALPAGLLAMQAPASEQERQAGHQHSDSRDDEDA